MDWLADPSWAGISVVAGILIAIGTIMLVRRPRLSWGYTTEPLVTAAPNVSESVQVLFRGVAVSSAHVQRLTVVNVGTVPITRADFESSLAIKYSTQVRILSAELTRRHPEDLAAIVEHVDRADGAIDEVRVAPLLLNPGDGFRLVLVVSGTDASVPEPMVTARVSGVRSLGWFDGDTVPLPLRLTRSLTVTLIAVALLFGGRLVLPQRVLDWGLEVLWTFVGVVVFVLVFVGVSAMFDRYWNPYKRLQR